MQPNSTQSPGLPPAGVREHRASATFEKTQQAEQHEPGTTLTAPGATLVSLVCPAHKLYTLSLLPTMLLQPHGACQYMKPCRG